MEQSHGLICLKIAPIPFYSAVIFARCQPRVSDSGYSNDELLLEWIKHFYTLSDKKRVGIYRLSSLRQPRLSLHPPIPDLLTEKEYYSIFSSTACNTLFTVTRRWVIPTAQAFPFTSCGSSHSNRLYRFFEARIPHCNQLNTVKNFHSVRVSRDWPNPTQSRDRAVKIPEFIIFSWSSEPITSTYSSTTVSDMVTLQTVRQIKYYDKPFHNSLPKTPKWQARLDYTSNDVSHCHTLASI